MVALFSPSKMLPLVGALLLLTHPARAELSADELLDKAFDESSMGLTKGTAKLKMQIFNARGEVKERTLSAKGMKNKEGLTRSLIRFDAPAQVRGIAFLVVEKAGSLPDQFVYVPAVKVVRRIATASATGSFFGSDFTYADLMPLPKEERSKIALKKLEDQKVGKEDAYRIEITPTVEGGPYSKVVGYIHKKHLVPLKMEFFDKKSKHFKTLLVKKLKKVKGKMIPMTLQMKNEKKGTKTILEILELDPSAKLSETDFTQEAMQR